MFGFKTPDQAAAFQRWAHTCGFDWTIEPRAQPLPHLEPPPERPPTYDPAPEGRGNVHTFFMRCMQPRSASNASAAGGAL
ncbi:MAG: hypothetical protein OJF58_001121 [Enhydrobacter sp.]|nr:MAG: hypothetical protein OJF58_001121 [Enhydrobacter sp.]